MKKPPDPDSLAARVRARRMALGWTQRDLAEAASGQPPEYREVSQQSINQLENGRNKSIRAIDQVAESLGVTTAWLKTGDDAFLPTQITEEHRRAMMLEFAGRIRDARKACGYSVPQAARSIFDQDKWKKMELAAYWPDPLELDLIAGRLGMSLDYLVRGDMTAREHGRLTTAEPVMLHSEIGTQEPFKRD